MLLRWEQIPGCIDSDESGVLALVKAGEHQHQHVFANFTPTERCSGRLAVLPDELARLPEPQASNKHCLLATYCCITTSGID